MLRFLLQSLVEVQRGHGIKWELSYHSEVFEVVFKLPVHFIVGNTKSSRQDVW
jgi:hypothetical protein